MTTQRSKPFGIGEHHTVTIEKVAHGGHFIARHEGQVLFVRHGIPGEEVEVEITSTGSSFVRADVVKVLTPSPHRVVPPCRFSHAKGCGGCDFQHISPSYQRDLKADVIKEQFSRIAKMDIEVQVEEVADPLGWRTRVIATSDQSGRLGFYSSRSHTVVPIDNCIITVPEMKLAELSQRKWPQNSRVEISQSSAGERTVSIASTERGAKARITEGPKTSHESIFGHDLEVSHGSFWQSHKDAPTVLSEIVRERVREGDRVLDLYGGVGLFTAAVLDIVGAEGGVDLIEFSRTATADATKNFSDFPNVRVLTGEVLTEMTKVARANVVILDPPREGAGKEVLARVASLRPRVLVYVACDPAALARDTAYLAEMGYGLETLRAFDLFPMTHHIECVATFTPSK